MRFEFIESQKKAYHITSMCLVLNVSCSGFFSWRKKSFNKRDHETALLKPLVKEIQKIHKSSCGSRRMAEKLTEAGMPTGRFKAARLMRDTNAPFVPTRKFRVTTDSKHNLLVSPNLLERNFTVEAPNQV